MSREPRFVHFKRNRSEKRERDLIGSSLLMMCSTIKIRDFQDAQKLATAFHHIPSFPLDFGKERESRSDLSSKAESRRK